MKKYGLLYLCKPKGLVKTKTLKCCHLSCVLLTNNHHSPFHSDVHYSEYYIIIKHVIILYSIESYYFFLSQTLATHHALVLLSLIETFYFCEIMTARTQLGPLSSNFFCCLSFLRSQIRNIFVLHFLN